MQNCLPKFPGTRFMGSKYKLLPFIEKSLADIKYNTVLDAFSGSGVISYMFKCLGKTVYSNDYLTSSFYVTKALIENNKSIVSKQDLDKILDFSKVKKSHFIEENFRDIYFSNVDNVFLDNISAKIKIVRNEYKQAILYAALVRACIKKRPRGVFTYVGDRYNDGRGDLVKSIPDHFIENVEAYNLAVFNNNQNNIATNSDIFQLNIDKFPKKIDLVYLDPPYLSKSSDNDYVRRYHFVEGLVTQWEGLALQKHTKTKKFKSYESLFQHRTTINKAFEDLFAKVKNSVIVLSYSSNSMPDKSTLIKMLGKHKKNVVVKEVDYLYSFGTHAHKINSSTNRVKEYLFIAQ